MQTQMKHRDTNRLLQRLQQAVSRPDLASHGIQLQHLGQVSGLPVVHVAIGHSSKPRVLVIAGTHGDEPASVEAAVQLLESFPVEWLDHFGVDVLPCTNPTGWRLRTRENAAGIDINWAFAQEGIAEVDILKAFLQGRRWQVVVDVHEDGEAQGFYLYEHQRQSTFIGPAVAASVAPACGLETAQQIDGWPAVGAVIHADDSVERLRRGDGLPLILLRDHTDHKLTTETPTSLPMAQRVKAHHLALAAIVDHHKKANASS
jgi:predicted deacylase